jgi:hypothetical protein
MLAINSFWQFNYAILKADRLFKANDIAGVEKVLRETAAKARIRPFTGWNPNHDWTTSVSWVTAARADMKMMEADKRRVFTVVRSRSWTSRSRR